MLQQVRAPRACRAPCGFTQFAASRIDTLRAHGACQLFGTMFNAQVLTNAPVAHIGRTFIYKVLLPAPPLIPLSPHISLFPPLVSTGPPSHISPPFLPPTSSQPFSHPLPGRLRQRQHRSDGRGLGQGLRLAHWQRGHRAAEAARRAAAARVADHSVNCNKNVAWPGSRSCFARSLQLCAARLSQDTTDIEGEFNELMLLCFCVFAFGGRG
jgi:hypothetical protein